MMHTPKPGGVTCCRRLQEALEYPMDDAAEPHVPMRSYFGIATSTAEQATAQTLLRMAEQNLETARLHDELRVVAD
jgi:hypothetical protein